MLTVTLSSELPRELRERNEQVKHYRCRNLQQYGGIFGNEGDLSNGLIVV